MTQQPQHPLNCDNCTNDDCEFHDKPTTKCNFAKPFFAKKGCASHSSRPAPSAPTYCLKCTSPEGICAEEDFCKGCDNFDAFFNSCKKTAYKQSSQNDEGKRTSGTVHPRTNASRWLLAVVGCASDTRKKVDSATIRNQTLDAYAKWDNTRWTTQRVKEYKESLRREGGDE